MGMRKEGGREEERRGVKIYDRGGRGSERMSLNVMDTTMREF